MDFSMQKITFILCVFLTCNYIGVLSADILTTNQLSQNKDSNHESQQIVTRLLPNDNEVSKNRNKRTRRKTRIMASQMEGNGRKLQHLGPELARKKGKGKPTKAPAISFDLSDCTTYQHEWLFDMKSSCIGNPLQNNYSGCRCYDAERRRSSNDIVCGEDSCPVGCPVCESCLYNVLVGCKPFDLSDCSTYAYNWLFDNMYGECTDAKGRLDRNEIQCDAQCPSNCQICEICMNSICN